MNVWTHPTARTRHRCELCWRDVLPGETYWRSACLDRGTAWTYKCCDHCHRVLTRWDRLYGMDQWGDDECIFEWLEDEHPALWASLRAHWRYPDGELLPLPFTPRCVTCGAAISDGYLWCAPCDERRIARIDGHLRGLASALSTEGGL